MSQTLLKLKSKFRDYDIDGYIIPKNDEFFSEYTHKDRLKAISKFSGSAGYAIILKNKNYLFVDGRYTLQAKIESGKNFKILPYDNLFNCKIFRNLKIGVDPKIITKNQIKNFFPYNEIKFIKNNLIDEIIKFKKVADKPFFSLNNKIAGESSRRKISKIITFLKNNNLDHIFISAPENVAWILNIRGQDSPNTPIPNSHLIISRNKKKFLITNKNKVQKLISKKLILKKEIIEPTEFKKILNKLKGKKISIDQKTCSIFFQEILKKKIQNNCKR